MAKLTDEQVTFLKSLGYVDGYEIKDLAKGFTDPEVLLKESDLEKFYELGDTGK